MGYASRREFIANSTAHHHASLLREGRTMGMIGFDIACESTEKRAENAESTRKCPLRTIGANTKRTDFALAA